MAKFATWEVDVGKRVVSPAEAELGRHVHGHYHYEANEEAPHTTRGYVAACMFEGEKNPKEGDVTAPFVSLEGVYATCNGLVMEKSAHSDAGICSMFDAAYPLDMVLGTAHPLLGAYYPWELRSSTFAPKFPLGPLIGVACRKVGCVFTGRKARENSTFPVVRDVCSHSGYGR